MENNIRLELAFNNGLEPEILNGVMSKGIPCALTETSESIDGPKALKIFIANTYLLIKGANEIKSLIGKEDSVEIKNQMVLWEKVRALVKMCFKCKEIDSLRAHGKKVETEKLLKTKKEVDKTQQLLSKECNSFPATICARAFMKYEMSFGKGELLLKINRWHRGLVDFLRPVAEEHTHVVNIYNEARKPNGAICWMKEKINRVGETPRWWCGVSAQKNTTTVVASSTGMWVKPHMRKWKVWEEQEQRGQGTRICEGLKTRKTIQQSANQLTRSLQHLNI